MLRLIIAYANLSIKKHINPLEKLILCILPIIIVSYSKSFIPLLLNIMIFLILHIRAKNPLSMVFKFTFAVFLFAAFSSITFIFDYGLKHSMVIWLKSVNGGLSASYLSLTTPMEHIFYVLSRKEGLRDICDIAKSMERFIILLQDEYYTMSNAMKARGGFVSFKLKVVNSGKLAALLFMNTMHRWKEIKDGINSRGYRGNMNYSNIEFDFSIFRIVIMTMYFIVLTLVVLICN